MGSWRRILIGVASAVVVLGAAGAVAAFGWGGGFGFGPGARRAPIARGAGPMHGPGYAGGAPGAMPGHGSGYTPGMMPGYSAGGTPGAAPGYGRMPGPGMMRGMWGNGPQAGAPAAGTPNGTATPSSSSSSSASTPAPTVAVKPDGQVSFRKDIEPIFQSQCASCHIGRQLGGLSLADYQSLMKGGASGPVVVKGEPGSSLIIQALTGKADSISQMPLGRSPLPEADIQNISDWIKAGAPNN